jgi:hypothetical protein
MHSGFPATAAKITRLEVEFDGEGDSGGLTGTTAYNGDAVVGIPPASVKLILVEYWDRPKIWGIMTIGIGPAGYVAGWGFADGIDAAFGRDGE